ncbi:Holliday junction resolvase RecU [Domibacillus enclensis]|uniref:Holliday junction resolvase RecU n=1 Tax=Domibacillus enclensis TaxID=1017273 RepID=A0A1N6P584_9BACI|nr:Holliday junction resolvase RecU [Domibacillus enclensis]OXS80244.1 Holliday junction resolvase RecU [Domibacillus enclensis]SIP99459.1 recombination protein U [Domibacillus enclensis]
MAIRYPNGKKYAQSDQAGSTKPLKKNSLFSNRGMTLEEDINESNAYYLSRNLAVIHKKPVPVQIVRVDYPARSAAVIKEAYFRQASTTDYNGVYKGKYIDFEAKETNHTSSFPLKNFHAHQISHMKQVEEHGGIAFVLIRFSKTDELFLLPFAALYDFWLRMTDGGRKSITKEEIENRSRSLKLGLSPRIPYLQAVDHVYF